MSFTLGALSLSLSVLFVKLDMITEFLSLLAGFAWLMMLSTICSEVLLLLKFFVSLCKMIVFGGKAPCKHPWTWWIMPFHRFLEISFVCLASIIERFCLCNHLLSGFFPRHYLVCYYYDPFSLHKKWSFPLRISSVNVTKWKILKSLIENFIFCAVFALYYFLLIVFFIGPCQGDLSFFLSFFLPFFLSSFFLWWCLFAEYIHFVMSGVISCWVDLNYVPC